MEFVFALELTPRDKGFLQLMNSIKREILLYHMRLQRIGRNEYDKEASVVLPNLKLEIWPGYKTSIRQHEDSLLMNVEVKLNNISYVLDFVYTVRYELIPFCLQFISKILRTDSVLDFMIELKTKCKGHVTDMTKQMMNQVVMTRYNNNRTYTIIDIDFKKDPRSTFKGVCTYSLQKFSKCLLNSPFTSTERWQGNVFRALLPEPLQLAHHQQYPATAARQSSYRRAFPDAGGHIYLVPELCTVTGLTDSMRSDYKLMAEIGTITRSGPPSRVAALQKYSNRMSTNVDSAQFLLDWGLTFAPNLLRIQGRTLSPEEILQCNNKTSKYNIDNAEWPLGR